MHSICVETRFFPYPQRTEPDGEFEIYLRKRRNMVKVWNLIGLSEKKMQNNYKRSTGNDFIFGPQPSENVVLFYRLRHRNRVGIIDT